MVSSRIVRTVKLLTVAGDGVLKKPASAARFFLIFHLGDRERLSVPGEGFS
jgi:hypothetical protein